MTRRFDYFVLFAEMRTGSNFLEDNINQFPGLMCYGEAFNPHFVGNLNKSEMFGIDLAAREENPIQLIDQMLNNTDGLPGFRLFHDHDPRVVAACLANPRCAKIVLTRNPVESYVSRKIAAQTGQWRLTDVKNQKTAKISFVQSEFEKMLSDVQGFQVEIQNQLQTTGQTAFYIAYEDINELPVLNGLAKFLEQSDQMDSMSNKLKKQNPSQLADKVHNFEEMQTSLAQMDRFNLARTPNFEPRRGAVIPTYMTSDTAGLLYMPVKGGPVERVQKWLATLDGTEPDMVVRDFKQKTLKQWKRQTKDFRSFCVISHPLTRAYRSFLRHIVPTEGSGAFTKIRRTLIKAYKVPLPQDSSELTVDEMRAAFLAFLQFLKGNLAGQSNIRVDAAWASQSEVLSGMGRFAFPDMLVREESLEQDLGALCAAKGLMDVPEIPEDLTTPTIALSDICDDDINQATLDAYQRDFLNFGYRKFRSIMRKI